MQTDQINLRIGKMPNMFCLLSNVLLGENNLLLQKFNFTKTIVNLSKLIQSAFFLVHKFEIRCL